MKTWVAVVLGVVAVFAILVAGVVIFALHIAAHTTIRTAGAGPGQVVDIRSPLGHVHVAGQGQGAAVDIESPFGNLHVHPNADPGRIGIAIYPGATLVASRQHSPFRHGVALGGNGEGATGPGGTAAGSYDGTIPLGPAPSASGTATMSAGNAAVDIAYGEFVTPATPDAVLRFYEDRFGPMGAVRTSQSHGATTLTLRLERGDARAVSVMSGDDGTHFVLVNVVGGSGGN